MTQWIEGRIAGKTFWTDHLFSIQVSADVEPFEAGQFVKLGLEIDGEIVGRAYSFASAPQVRPLDFYIVTVEGGALTPRLEALAIGAPVMVTVKPAGHLVLHEIPDAEELWMLSTGTGLAPFVAMLGTEELWQRFPKIIIVHGVRHAAELSYRETFTDAQRQHPGRLIYVPFVTREACDFALPGRIPPAIANGELEKAAGCPIAAERSHFLLCGNPDMVKDATNILIERGLRKHKRKEAGHISLETYW